MKRCVAAVVTVATIACLVASGVGGAQTATPTPVRTEGVGKPPKGAGMGTTAALQNPKCSADSVDGWGTFSFVTENGGPFCVAPAPDDNGGTTSRGVDAESIKVVVVLATPEQLAQQASAGSQSATNEATGEVGKIRDAFVDLWPPYARYYELWGREVEFVLMDSSGGDEAAQRADALKVKAEKPFAMIDSTPDGLTVLQTLAAQDRTVVFGYGTTVEDTLTQSPYRWGQTDQQSGAVNVAEFAGKQLVKRKAQYAGDTALQSTNRAFGAIYTESIDIDGFEHEFAEYGGKLATPALKYETTPGILGDPASAQEQAPNLVTKLKAAGVTTVFLFSDIGMNGAITRAATQQEFFPEWILTGYQFADLSILSRNYDQQQWAHAFGISNLFPYVRNAPNTLSALNWYWGEDVATSSTLAGAMVGWLAAGIQYAGPTLTPKNFRRGFFAVPARGGAASDNPASFMGGYGRTPGLPYDEYMALGTDFAPVWYDPEVTGEAQVRGNIGKGVTMYVDGAKRYLSGEWPKQPFPFFDPARSIYVFDARPVPSSPEIPCDGCPSTGGAGTPAAVSSQP